MTNSAPFPVRLVGRGPHRVVVAHGWMGDHELYTDFFGMVDEELFSYAFFDCRGYGVRRPEEGPLTVEAIADDAVTVADALGWERFHVLGHSMGAMAAQWLMATHPARIVSAVLLAPVPASGAHITDERRTMLLAALHSSDARRALIDANTGGIRSSAWLDRLLDLSLAGTVPEALEGYMTSWTGPGFLSRVEGSNAKVLVVAGMLDPGTSSDRIEATYLTWYPNSRFVPMQGTGHYPMIECPAHLIRIIGAHVESDGSIAADML